MGDDPFVVLGLDEGADDEAIKRRYLALVRTWPPDREPEKFQAIRRAYEAIGTQRQRLESTLLHTSGAALSRLKLHCLSVPGGGRRRPSPSAMTALLMESLLQAGS
jgi:hypothetical protein